MKKMTKKKKLDGQDGQDGLDPAGAGGGQKNPLDSAAGREWLARELAAAEHEETHGPGGEGWLHNETLREAITERAEFLRAVVSRIRD